jgi:DnaJ family protein C protein 2
VFARNARFSSRKPVPLLGGAEDEPEEVDAFYKFWFAFDSWREFSHLGKEKVDEADGRDERREREKKNKADAAKGKKADVKRVADLVDRAYARDPRVKAMLAREEAEKKAEKNKKNAGKYAAEAEEARLKAEAAKAKATDDGERNTRPKAQPSPPTHLQPLYWSHIHPTSRLVGMT